MLIKTALLSGAALLTFVTAPALAQDMTTNPVPPATQDTPAAPPAAPAPGTMQIQPGSNVKGSDGTVLGKLEGVQTVSGAQQLKVRGTDGVLRGVPLGGLKPDGAGIAVAWTASEFQASPAIEDTAPPAEQPAASEPTTAEPAPAETPPVAPPTPPTGTSPQF